MTDIEPKNLKVTELRDELKKRNLDTKGKKEELVKRLEEALGIDGGPDGDTDNRHASDNENDASRVGDSSALDDTVVERTQEDDGDDGAPETGAGDGEEAAEYGEEEGAVAEPGEESRGTGEEESRDAGEEESRDLEPAPEEETPEEGQQQEGGAAPEGGPEDTMEQGGESAEGYDEAQREPTGEEAEQAGEEEGMEPEGEFVVQDELNEEGEGGEKAAARKRSRSPVRRSRSPKDRRRRAATPPPVLEDDTWLQSTEQQLDRYNADLNLTISSDYTAAPLSQGGFAFMWAGVRATYGVKTGKVAFEVKVTEDLSIDVSEDEKSKHVVIVGWSTDASSFQLGEDPLSWCYSGMAKKANNSDFTDYGTAFGKGDVITAYLDLESDPVVISYSKNGEDVGVAFEVSKEALNSEALFPHVQTKNCEFTCNFGQKEEPFYALRDGFVFIGSVPLEERVRGSVPPAKKEDAEVLMMIGLPSAGKTHWAKEYAKSNPEKKFNLLGTDAIMNKMKINGVPRKQLQASRWDVLFDKSKKCLSRLLDIAAKKLRNYIMDQTNVYASAQRDKLRPFEGFQRKAIVVVPSEEEFKKRIEKRIKEEGKGVPNDVVLEMKANFSIPKTGEGSLFEAVTYSELPEAEARKLVEQYVKEGQAKFPAGVRRFRDDRYGDRSRYQDSGRDRDRGSYGSRDNSYKDRNYGGSPGGYRGSSYRGSNYRGGYRGTNYIPGYRGGYRGDYRGGYSSGYSGGSSSYRGRGGYDSGYAGAGAGGRYDSPNRSSDRGDYPRDGGRYYGNQSAGYGNGGYGGSSAGSGYDKPRPSSWNSGGSGSRSSGWGGNGGNYGGGQQSWQQQGGSYGGSRGGWQGGSSGGGQWGSGSGGGGYSGRQSGGQWGSSGSGSGSGSGGYNNWKY